MENREEVKVETKKKGNGLFTLFACVMTGVIVYLAMNVGNKAGKVVDPEVNTNKESNITSNVESNSNVASNVTSNVVSNSNITSNVTTNTASDVPSSDLYSFFYNCGYDESKKESYCSGERLKIENGVLYAKVTKSDSNTTISTYDDYSFSKAYKYNKFNKVLDNVKRIKGLSIDSDISITYFAILNDGTVKYVHVDEETGKVTTSDATEFKGYKVDDIVNASGGVEEKNGHPNFFKRFTVKLTDGTTKEIG